MARGRTVDPAGSFQADKRGDGRHLLLEGVVGAARAHALQETARRLAVEGVNVTIGLAELRHLDCAGVQVLLALDETLRQQGRSLALESVPESVSATFRNAGLGHLG